MIVQALRLHETTVNRHISDYLNHRKLKLENGGFQSYLCETQTQEFIAYLTNRSGASISQLFLNYV